MTARQPVSDEAPSMAGVGQLGMAWWARPGWMEGIEREEEAGRFVWKECFIREKRGLMVIRLTLCLVKQLLKM